MQKRSREKKTLRRFVFAVVILVILSFIVFLLGWFLSSTLLSFNRDREEESPRMIIGLSKIRLEGGELIGTQVDRVSRDIHWDSPSYDESVEPGKIITSTEDLVPYMEGARAREMIEWASVKIFPLTPARGKYIESADPWPEKPYYAGDGVGSFSFLIEPTKVEYDTVFFPEDDSEEADIILPDTHGFNMIAEKAYLHKDQLHTVMACMDFESKTEAALYLAKQGMNIYAPCDRFTSLLMNYEEIYPNTEGVIIGSAPIRKTDFGAVIGDQPVVVYLDEKIVVQYTEKGYPDQYCDTPWRYFKRIEEVFNLQLETITVEANIGETEKIINVAEEKKANVIGVRVMNGDDYGPVEKWLRKDYQNRAVLFHSAGYRGIDLFREFPEQVTFGDLQPKIIK